MSKKPKRDSRSTHTRKRVNLRAAITDYMRRNPTAQYFEMIYALYGQGMRINRHGNAQMYGWWEQAKKDAQRPR